MTLGQGELLPTWLLQAAEEPRQGSSQTQAPPDSRTSPML